MNVLVVEDERNLSDVICRIMKENKYKYDAVYNGVDGYGEDLEYCFQHFPYRKQKFFSEPE